MTTTTLRRNWTDSLRVTGFIEPAENERWAIEQVVPDSPFGGSMGGVFRTGRGIVKEGETYTVLYRKSDRGGRTLVMSDTPDELRDMLPIRFAAPRGRVLVNGLGLGCAVKGLLSLEEVEHIDVVEFSPEIIELVGPYYDDDRVTIHEGDAFTFTWPPGTRWDFAWHDVWDDLCVSNLTEAGGDARPGSYEKLHRRYARRVRVQASWGWEFLQRQRRF